MSISIGYTLVDPQRRKLVLSLVNQGLSLEWDGPDFDVTQFPDDGPLLLYAHEVALGWMDDLEGFCAEYALPFVHLVGRCPGQFGPERAVLHRQRRRETL